MQRGFTGSEFREDPRVRQQSNRNKRGFPIYPLRPVVERWPRVVLRFRFSWLETLLLTENANACGTLPVDESARVQTLKDYQILDTLAEREYDDIVQIASRICKTPIALVSLVDSDRQWFKRESASTLRDSSKRSVLCAVTQS